VLLGRDRVVVVGASLAGVRAAETLRAEGFTGPVTVVGAEAHRPYDRPPLSKQVLTGEWDAERVALKAGVDGALDVDWRLGVPATGLDLSARHVTLADGDRIGFDGLVIATGARARGLPGTEHLAGVHTLRTLDDALALREQVAGAGTRVVVVGAGFIGCEVAASCRARGASVTVVEPLEQPLARVLGPTVGAVVAAVHREHGVDVRLGVGVAAVEGDTQVRAVTLADGSTIDADVVVVGIGVVPDTGWLEGSGLTLVDGVVCDATTLAAPGVVAAGDVARWPNETFGELMRVEHWEHALDMGAHAARRLLTPDHEATPYAPVPWFWSDQYDRKIQMAGRVRPDDEMVVVAGSFEDRRFCALYGRDGRVVGALGMNMPARIVKLRTAIAHGLRWDDALRDLTAGPP
jgi:NADPH-dependent 2,4-dienoyl-CoA reductase/sulfur reductase-like enzyme